MPWHIRLARIIQAPTLHSFDDVSVVVALIGIWIAWGRAMATL